MSLGKGQAFFDQPGFEKLFNYLLAMKTGSVTDAPVATAHDLGSDQKISFGLFNPLTRQGLHT